MCGEGLSKDLKNEKKSRIVIQLKAKKTFH